MSEIATFAGGCFWCIEAAFRRVKGVVNVISGYTGGGKEDANYQAVSTGTTEHVEAVQVEFDPQEVTYSSLLDVFWLVHNPMQADGQGADVGPQYRAKIFVHSPEQEKTALSSKDLIEKQLGQTVRTEIATAKEFFPAETYHYDYYERNPHQAYCQVVITPKLKKLRQQVAALLISDEEALSHHSS